MSFRTNFVFFFLFFTQCIWANCTLLNSSNQIESGKDDLLSQLLQTVEKCPGDVFQFRERLKEQGLILKTSMVANRGFHNPGEGSFSLFEVAYGKSKLQEKPLALGDFFWGHFTGVDENNVLIADQNPRKNALMIEALVWDEQKGYYNFYELRGDGTQGQWYYRGDSADIFLDNEFLHRQPDPSQPTFGSRLRCSGCHGAGGPIMKEIYSPYNDWWVSERPLDFGGRSLDSSLTQILLSLVPAQDLREAVTKGMEKLQASEKFAQKTSLDLQEQLRPLFCPMEINFQSDLTANDSANAVIVIPAEFFVDGQLLTHKEAPILIARENYQLALNATNSHFPETSLNDGDHAWLTPVKAASDKLAIKRLIRQGLVNQNFVWTVLSIDMTNPVSSASRCGLLRYLPKSYTADWQDIFIKNLSTSEDWAARTLYHRLTTEPKENYPLRASRLLSACRTKFRSAEQVEKLYTLLIQRRLEIQESELSKNPLGQILEPGFRVIFPETNFDAKGSRFKLTESCELSLSS